MVIIAGQKPGDGAYRWGSWLADVCRPLKLGDKNADLQVTKYGANSQPYYFFLDGQENKLAKEGYGYDADIQKFIAHLNKVKMAFNK